MSDVDADPCLTAQSLAEETAVSTARFRAPTVKPQAHQK